MLVRLQRAAVYEMNRRDLWSPGALPPLIHSCINPSLFRAAEISLRSPPILSLFSTNMCWFYAVKCFFFLPLYGFNSLSLALTLRLLTCLQIQLSPWCDQGWASANVSCLITPGWRESGYNRASVWALAPFLKKCDGIGQRNGSAPLKGLALCCPVALVMPACCQPCWQTVGDWVGVCVGGGSVGGRSDSPMPPSLASFCW